MCKRNLRVWAGISMAVATLFISGCVSERLEPEHTPQLSVVQDSEGWVTMGLETKVGYDYSIMYLDPKERIWKQLKGYDKIKGTGELVQIRKKMRKGQEIPSMTVNFVKY